MLEEMIVDDIGQVALRPWPNLGAGVTGLYLHFVDYQITDGRIVELPVQGDTVSQRYLFEHG